MKFEDSAHVKNKMLRPLWVSVIFMAWISCVPGYASSTCQNVFSQKTLNSSNIDREIPITLRLKEDISLLNSPELQKELLQRDSSLPLFDSINFWDQIARVALKKEPDDHTINAIHFPHYGKDLPWVGTIQRYVQGAPQDGGMLNTFYKEFNRKLRKNEPLTENEKKWYQDLLQALDHLPAVEGISFRGVQLTVDQFNSSFKVGEIVKDGAFVSTSLDPTIAKHYATLSDRADKMSIIVIIEGRSGKPVSLVSSLLIAEQEILYTPATQFIVKGVSETIQSADIKNKTMFVYLQETALH